MNKLINYNKLIKSKLTPPSYIFGIVWPILYLMIFLSFMFYILSSNKKSIYVIILFIIQIILNLSWSPVFFRFNKIKIAFIIIILLWLSILGLIINFYKINQLASYLLIPYFIWVTFATYLNLFIILNN